MTHNEKVLRHLTDYGEITPVEAMEGYGIMRLAARISELRREGHEITSEIVKGHNRYGEAVHYAKYKMERKKRPVEECCATCAWGCNPDYRWRTVTCSLRKDRRDEMRLDDGCGNWVGPAGRKPRGEV